MNATVEAAYYRLRPNVEVARQVQPTPWLIMDYGADDRVVGLEVLGDHSLTDALVEALDHLGVAF